MSFWRRSTCGSLLKNTKYVVIGLSSSFKSAQSLTLIKENKVRFGAIISQLTLEQVIKVNSRGNCEVAVGSSIGQMATMGKIMLSSGLGREPTASPAEPESWKSTGLWVFNINSKICYEMKLAYLKKSLSPTNFHDSFQQKIWLDLLALELSNTPNFICRYYWLKPFLCFPR